MIRQVMESAGLAWWPVLSLLLFFGFSIATVLWLYRKGSKEFYAELSQLALADEAPQLRAPKQSVQSEPFRFTRGA